MEGRKYFYNTRSWKRFEYAKFILGQINDYLEGGHSVLTSKGIVINTNDRYVFIKDNMPGIFRTIGGAHIKSNLIESKDSKIYISKSCEEIYSSIKRCKRWKNSIKKYIVIKKHSKPK